jgi:branched-subunit amino acid ABC-type transport system permease component
MMVGAYSMYAMRALPFIVALVLTVAFGFVLGLVLERGILRWVYDKGFMATLLASWGVGTVLEQGVAAIFTVSQRGVDSPLTGKLTIGDFSYPVYRVVVAAGIIALLAILLLLVYRTTLGLRLRASIDNVEMASVLGISPQRMFAMVFSLATALAVLAGALIAPTIAINPTLGLSFLAPAFFAVLVSKPGSLAGPVVGAMAVQAVFTLLQAGLSVTVAESALFGLLALFIVLRPQGISWTWKTARKETS